MKSDELLEKEEKLCLGMNEVFTECINKACDRLNRKGNTEQPWKDFTPSWLGERLEQEWDEWKKSGDSRELIDIINLACFLRLSKIYHGVNLSPVS